MKNILLIITLFVSWNTFEEEKTWFCATEKRAGLLFSNNAWKTTTFIDKRMTVRQTDNNLKFSENKLGFGSEKKCSGILSFVSCSDYSTIFTLNQENGLATSASTYGWLSGLDGNYDTVDTSLWKCESF